MRLSSGNIGLGKGNPMGRLIGSFAPSRGGGTLTNYALPSTGSVASASSSSWGTIGAVNGVRHTLNAWGAESSAWESAGDPASSPEWLQIDFGASRNISEINVYTLADSLNYDTDPLSTDTFTQYGVVDFKLQYWDGAAWVDITSVVANDKVWRRFTFSVIATQKVRILVTKGGPSSPKARVVEFEVWGV